MASERRQVKLGFSIWASGQHPAGWRLPEASAHGTFDPGFMRDTARAAERGKLDYYFVGDRVVGLPSSQYEAPNEVLRPEALTLAAFIAAATTHIGIITTVNTTYSDPYTVARAIAELDHLSRGRMAWNIVTGKNEEAAGNYGRESHWDSDRRYSWTSEFIEVVRGLWDTWEDDALVADKGTGQFVDEAKVHRLNYRGRHFSVNGPINIARPPQGHVPMLHAGTSVESHEFGAQYADIRFILLQDFEAAQAYYRNTKAMLANYGRDEDQPLVAGLPVFVAGTAREAHAKFRQVQNLTVGQPNLTKLSDALGVDVTGYPADLPLDQIPELGGLTGRPALIVNRAQHALDDSAPLLGELALYVRRTGGNEVAVGDGPQVADFIERHFEARTTDGFILFPPYLPGPLDAFVDLVVPELQRRGLFRTEYPDHATFREFFGLAKPENQFVAGTLPAAAHPDTEPPTSYRAEHFVTAAELAKLQTDPRPPVVLDVRNANSGPAGRPEYEAGHIPGAVYVDLPTELQGVPEAMGGFSGARPLPPVEQLQDWARAWGISQGDPVVVYDNVSGTKAGRAWFVLRWAGIASVRLLDGGYQAWTADGHPVSTAEPDPVPGDVVLSPGHLPVLDADGAAEFAARGQLYDARGRGQFEAGHIPGATAAPTTDNLTGDGLLQDEPALRARFAALGIDGSQPVGVYCGGGVAGAHELAVLASLGLPAALFVGSFSAWSSDPDRPIETTTVETSDGSEA
jgi:FMN-dependent oxidoreductase (nitrilotriacetate monooxygenase family)